MGEPAIVEAVRTRSASAADGYRARTPPRSSEALSALFNRAGIDAQSVKR